MKITLFTAYGALNSPPVFNAIRQGLQKLGYTVVDNDMSADVAVIWSVLWHGRMTANQSIFEEFQRLNKPIIVAEVGSLQRGQTWKLSIFDPVQRYPRAIDDARWTKSKLVYKQGSARGDNIVIACQRTDSLQWHSQPDLEVWLQETINRIRLFTGRPIIIRPHPRQILSKKFHGTIIQNPLPLLGTYDSFDFHTALSNTRVVINHNASPGVLSFLSGVPVIAGPSGITQSLAQEVSIGFDNIESDRIGYSSKTWLNKIAHTEWSINEIESGLPLELLLK